MLPLLSLAPPSARSRGDGTFVRHYPAGMCYQQPETVVEDLLGLLVES